MASVSRPRHAQRHSRLGTGLALALFVALSLAAGGIGTLLQGDALEAGGWYDGLDKPFFTPPDAVFAPVWTTLYVLIGIAGWRLWRRSEHPAASMALALWAFQLLVNAIWTGAFFGLESPSTGLVVIVILVAAIVTLAVRALDVDRVASLLLLPYLGWVLFATALNAGIFLMN
jgi:tryptophan-rich sensory protein